MTSFTDSHKEGLDLLAHARPVAAERGVRRVEVNEAMLLSAVAHLREAAADLDTALEFGNIPNLFAMRAEWLRNCHVDLDALLVQLGAMKMQLAEYVWAAEDDRGQGENVT